MGRLRRRVCAARELSQPTYVARELSAVDVRSPRTFPANVRGARTFVALCGPNVLSLRAQASKALRLRARTCCDLPVRIPASPTQTKTPPLLGAVSFWRRAGDSSPCPAGKALWLRAGALSPRQATGLSRPLGVRIRASSNQTKTPPLLGAVSFWRRAGDSRAALRATLVGFVASLLSP